MKTSRIISLSLTLALSLLVSAELLAQPSGTVWSKNVALLAKTN
jgi:hypothetical protein